MKYVQIYARGDRDGEQWLCTAFAPEPFIGLYAWGDTFGDAREALAQTVWAQLASTPGAHDAVKGVRVFCVTHRSFRAAVLNTHES